MHVERKRNSHELCSQSVFWVLFETDGNSNCDHADEEQSESPSATLIR
jgi:hypothetical protein